MPSAFPTLLVLSFYHNVSTRNTLITFLNTALTHLAINADTLIYTTAIPFSIVDELNWPSTPLFQFTSIAPIVWLISGKIHPIFIASIFHIISSSFEPYSKVTHRRTGKTTYWYIIYLKKWMYPSIGNEAMDLFHFLNALAPLFEWTCSNFWMDVPH